MRNCPDWLAFHLEKSEIPYFKDLHPNTNTHTWVLVPNNKLHFRCSKCGVSLAYIVYNERVVRMHKYALYYSLPKVIRKNPPDVLLIDTHGAPSVGGSHIPNCEEAQSRVTMMKALG